MCLHNVSGHHRSDRIDQLDNNPASNLQSLVNNDLVLLDNKCVYLEPSNVKELDVNDSSLNILHANIHSVPSKIGELKRLLKTLNDNDTSIDIILLCETFITDLTKSQCSIPGYQLEEKHRSKKSKGGVAIYINNKLRYKCRNDLSIFKEGQFESLFVELQSNKQNNIIIGEVYRVPGTNEKDFITDYEELVNKMNIEKKEIIIGTDQNLDYLKLSQHANTAKFLEVNLATGLLPCIIKPTRVTHSSATLIDNIYVSNMLSRNSQSCILLSDMSDHFPCLTMIRNVSKENKNPLVFKSRKIYPENIENISERLSQYDWNNLDGMDCNSCYDLVLDRVTTCLNEECPEKITVIPYNKIIKEPWMTKGLMKSADEKDKLYRKSIGLSKDHPSYIAYIAYRNKYNALKRKARQEYYCTKIEEFKYNIKMLWGVLRSLIGKKNDKSFTSDCFLIDGKMVTDPHIISEGFCKFYTNMSKNLADKISRSNRSFVDYMGQANDNSLFLSPTDENEIDKHIKLLPSKTSSGYDGISNVLLKGLSNVLKGPLSVVFNKSLSEGIFPSNMKTAEIVPLYKSKERYLFSNFRPISLLPVISKVLEKLVHKRVYRFLLQSQILFESQYGFRSGHNTTNAVTEMIGNVLKGFENNEVTVALYLDLSKAFDTLKHSTLLSKLETYGIRGVALNWFESYLMNRSHYVKYNGTKSHPNDMPLEYGVPQGSVLGPLLYLIFCNDFYKSMEFCKTIMYADDTNMYVTHKSAREALTMLKHDFDTAIDWFKANKLSLNLNKTNYMIFRPKTLDLDENLSFTLNGEEINLVNVTKFLGVFVDENLNWNRHLEHVCNQLSKGLYVLRNSKNILPNWTKKMLYYSYFYSHIIYGITLWGPMCTMAYVNRIFNMQKKAVRLIENAPYNAEALPLFKKYKILKFSDIVDLDLAKLAFLYSKQLLPSPVMGLFNRGSQFHSYNTRNRNNPLVSKHKSTIYSKSFLCKSPIILSNMNDDVKSAKHVKSFSGRFKRLVVSNY